MNQMEGQLENNRKELFLRVIAHNQIKTVFQPIISLRDGLIYGYEALSRGPENTDMHSPTMLFEYAEKYDKVPDLEFLCCKTAIETVNDLQLQNRLFINVNPNLLANPTFQQFSEELFNQYTIDPENVIFEITERNTIDCLSDFLNTIRNFKDQNYKIAIDDAGAGHSGLNMISDIHPHCIKLDINLIRDIDRDITKQALVRSMVEFAQLSNTILIAEGIETESELLKLIDMGLQYGQGYFIQRPDASINPIGDNILKIIAKANQAKNRLGSYNLSDIYISNICKQQKSLSPTTLVSEVYDMINKNPAIPGFCITEGSQIIGVITRNELFKHLSGLYGYALYSNKEICSIMSKEFLCLDYRDSIDHVAKIAMHRDTEKIYDFITIKKENKYYGIVTIKDLLEKSVQVKVNNAKHLNPLTELPGNLLIEWQLGKCVDSNLKNTVLYIDMNNFKSYNDVYGFGNGDKVIKGLTKILKNNIPEDNFIGHIGGDDFLAILSEDVNAEDICKRIINEFDQSILSYYNQNDLDNGYIKTQNRHGIIEKFPLLSLSIAGASTNNYTNVIALSEHVAKIKSICKQKQGSNYKLLKSNLKFQFQTSTQGTPDKVTKVDVSPQSLQMLN